MGSFRRVLGTVVMVFVVLQATTPFEAVDRKAIPLGGENTTAAKALINSGRADAVSLVTGGAPADSASSSVTYFDAEKVTALFAKGGVLYNGNGGKENFQVVTARRDKAGEVEIHTLDTDVIYVLEGTDAIVTGGTPVNSKTTAPNELRGGSIEGGETRLLSKGDVMIVPKGVPHWFKEAPARGPFLYFVVKVR